MRYIKLLHLILVFAAIDALAQGEQTLYFMTHVFQSTYNNTAAIPDHKFSIGFPGISSVYAGFANNSFDLATITSVDESANSINQSGNRKIDLNKIAKAASANNFIYTGFQVDIFHMRAKWRRSFVSFNVATKMQYYTNLPKAFFELPFGNIDPVTGNGKDLDFTNFAIDLTTYNEYALGFNKSLKNFYFATRVKYLQGLANINLETDVFALRTDPRMYDLSFELNAPIRQSLIVDTSSNLFSNLYKNNGFGLDIGGTYIFRKKWNFSIFANNLGFITWRSNTTGYDLTANGTYQGLPVFGKVLRGENIDSLGLLEGFINYISEPSTRSIPAYTRILVPRFYASAQYYITPRAMLGLLLFADYYKALRMGVSLAGQYKIGRILSLTSTVTQQYSRTNLGLGFMLKGGPAQFYFVTDNINLIINPNTARAFSVRTGINLVFSRTSLDQNLSSPIY